MYGLVFLGVSLFILAAVMITGGAFLVQVY